MSAEHERIREALLQGSELEPGTADPETLFFVESELIEDHLEGSLTGLESEMFLANFLVTEERREHLNEVRMLKRFSSDAFEFDASVFDEPDGAAGKYGPKFVTFIVLAGIVLILILLAILLY